MTNTSSLAQTVKIDWVVFRIKQSHFLTKLVASHVFKDDSNSHSVCSRTVNRLLRGVIIRKVITYDSVANRIHR